MSKKQIGPYTCIDMVQSNSSWQIYNAIHSKNNDRCTIKQIPIIHFQTNNLIQETIINEIECMKTISRQYPNSGIQGFETTLKSQNNLYLIYDKFYEVNVGPMKSDQSIKYFNQILMSVNLIHQQGYIHGDIHQGTIKLADYDNVVLTGGYFYRQDTSNRILDVTQENNANFTSYMAPEIMKGENVSKATDIYQLGILLYWMINGQLPFGETIQEKEQLNLRYYSKEQIPNNMKQVLRGMLQPDPIQRMTFKQIQLILNNFKSIDDDQDMISEKLNTSKLERELIKKELGLMDNLYQQDVIRTKPDKQCIYEQNFPIQLLQQVRNKYIFLVNVSCAILDMNISNNCLLSSLIMTRLAYMISQELKKQVEKVELTDSKQKIQIYESQFHTIVNKEMNQIQNSYEMQIKGLPKSSQYNIDQFRQDFINLQQLSVKEKQKLLQYVRELRSNLDSAVYQSQEQVRWNIMIHLNNILDCIKLDDFFNEFMVKSECILTRQPYFKMIESLSQQELMTLIEQKIQRLAWV